jgi:hypothetical protein
MRKLVCISVVVLAGCVTTKKAGWSGDGKLVQTAAGVCLEMTPESAYHRVAICESPDQKSFAVLAPGREPTVFPKDRAQALLKDRIGQLLAGTAYPAAQLNGATIELWVVAPVFAPESVYLTAFVKARGGNFSVRLPLEPEAWAPQVGDVALLGDEVYPARTAHKAGRVVVTARPHVRADEFRQFLRDNGLSGQGDASVELTTAAFGEEAPAKALLKAKHAKHFVQAVELEPAAETDGAKARALAFTVTSF